MYYVAYFAFVCDIIKKDIMLNITILIISKCYYYYYYYYLFYIFIFI